MQPHAGTCPPTGTRAHAAAVCSQGHMCVHTRRCPDLPACTHRHKRGQDMPPNNTWGAEYQAAPLSLLLPLPASRRLAAAHPHPCPPPPPPAQASPGWLRGSRGCGDPSPGAEQAGSPCPEPAAGPDGAAAAAHSGSCSSVDARRDAAAWRTERGRGTGCSSGGGGAVRAGGGAGGGGSPGPTLGGTDEDQGAW